MPLPSPTAVTDFSARVAALADRFFTADVAFYEAGTKGAYDAVTDSYIGGTPDELLFEVEGARVQQLRAPRDASKRSEWGTRQDFLIQIQLEDEVVALQEGHIVKVTNGGRDPKLVGLALQITGAINSSLAAVRTVNATADV